ncbi:helix-turn-helix transcriptional regulator [Rhizobium bangladeshense]|uniref:helix-turn-helix transcriptional regulator n=1 Tax=Rhizobium TaxID=379 RepID=UPI001C83901A|nr:MULTISPECIES: helix-turn-helix transcriptional regulator [Rhizobium]MBX4911395.1 helix-turn-helix transcriptional regulator [Rhizobium bangladeshense]MBX5130689.1 helix-turn-helix transcriptional regulator [Rhizobium lentis]
MSTTYVRPYANTKVARFLDKHIDQKVSKSHREIAQAAGWTQSNMVTMIKKGDAKLPLDRVTSLARAIDVDPMFLFRLALEQFLPDEPETARMLDFICTSNEAEILGIIREVSGNSDPKVNDQQRAALVEAFTK